MAMRIAMRTTLSVLIIVGAAGLATSCTKANPSARAGAASSQGCAPVKGKTLTLLADDKKLQAVDNVMPAISAAVATPALLAALDKASAALTPDTLVGLNKATDVDHKTPKVAAEEFTATAKLTEGVGKGAGGRIIVGATNYNESQTLGFVYQIVLAAAGYDASVEPIGSRETYEPALEKNSIQVVPEYTGTLTEFLNKKINGANATTITSGNLDTTVAALQELGKKVGLEFGKPATASAQNAFAVTRALADKYSLKTLSDFAARCSGRATILGGPAECPNRPFCQPGLEKTYGIRFGRFASLDAGGPRSKGALTDGTATIALVFSSDAALANG